MGKRQRAQARKKKEDDKRKRFWALCLLAEEVAGVANVANLNLIEKVAAAAA